MHFVYQVNLVAPAGWLVLDVVQQLTGIFNFCARSSIDFKQINIVTLLYFDTGTALTARVSTLPLFTVKAFREYPRDSGFTYPTRSCKQVSMMQAIVIQRIGDRRNNVLLANQFSKSARPPFSCQYLICHR